VWIKNPITGDWFDLTDWPDGLLKCDVVGTGAMLIHRSVFERIPTPWFTNDYSQVQALDMWPGEDVGFCHKCGDAGIDIWCDTTTTSPHLSTTAVDQATYRAYIEAYPEMGKAELDWIKEHCGWLWDSPGRVLYVGANTKRAYMAKELKEARNQLSLLEIWPANCDHYRGNGLFGEVIQGDVRSFYSKMHWDTAVWLHGPEHIQKDEIGAALGNLEAVADNVVVMAPLGYMEQGVFRGNPHEQHVSEWVASDLEAMGYWTATRGRKDEAHAALLAWKRRGAERDPATE